MNDRCNHTLNFIFNFIQKRSKPLFIEFFQNSSKNKNGNTELSF